MEINLKGAVFLMLIEGPTKLPALFPELAMVVNDSFY